MQSEATRYQPKKRNWGF